MNPQFLMPPEIAGEPQPFWPPLVALGALVLVIAVLAIVEPPSAGPKSDAFVHRVPTE